MTNQFQQLAILSVMGIEHVTCNLQHSIKYIALSIECFLQSCGRVGFGNSCCFIQSNITTEMYIVTLNFGKLPAGLYIDRSQAAFWNGRNGNNEYVASGVYFGVLSIGNNKKYVQRLLMAK